MGHFKIMLTLRWDTGNYKISTRVYASCTPEYATLHYKIMQTGEHTDHSRVH